MSIGRSLSDGLERTVYVIAGLPIAIRGVSLAPSPEAAVIRRAFARRYWRPDLPRDAAALVLGLLLTPIAVPAAALWFTFRNGWIIRRREGKGVLAQFVEQFRLYFASGILGPWYYILSLHRDGMRRAPTFLQRCETKRGIYGLLKTKNPTPLGQKRAFAELCAAAGVRCVACELVIDGSEVDPGRLPDCDLFVKPLIGCGGKGAERWDRVAPRTWSDGSETLGAGELVERLRSRERALIVQRRVQSHPALEALTSGAVPTVRTVTIIDEQGRPEVVATVFRMSIGANRTVDNFHAGGIACAVSLEDGTLGIASDLGSDARLGWHRTHPTTGARIEGVGLPFWDDLKRLAVQAHTVFSDRLIIGWDIAIAKDGPTIIEGNRGPDLDIVQRFMDTGFCEPQRISELIAHHLIARGWGLPKSVSAPDATRRAATRGAAGTSSR